MKPPLPANERERLQELRSYQILDSQPEGDFDDLVHIAAAVCNVPIALISLVDSERQWFKARVGLRAAQTHRNHSFCAHAVQHGETMIVPDAMRDERCLDNPLVVRDPHIRFYAGAPLRTAHGCLGTLCVIDTKPRTLAIDDRQVKIIEALSRQAVLLLELRRTGIELAEALANVKLAEQAREQTLAFLSHDLRSPMTSLMALVNQHRREPEALPTTELLAGVETYARRNLDASEEFLQLARAERGDIELYDIELCAVAQNAIDAVHAQARERDVRFHLVAQDDSGDGLWTRGNGQLIERAVTNLLVNSLKYGPRNATVRVTLVRDPTHDRIEVCDEGPGVAADEREKIFEPYYRARADKQGSEVGSGLGLALVKAVAERHGGSATVDSLAGGGAVFTVLLAREL